MQIDSLIASLLFIKEKAKGYNIEVSAEEYSNLSITINSLGGVFDETDFKILNDWGWEIYYFNINSYNNKPHYSLILVQKDEA